MAEARTPPPLPPAALALQGKPRQGEQTQAWEATQVLAPQGLKSVSRPEHESFRLGTGEPYIPKSMQGMNRRAPRMKHRL